MTDFSYQEKLLRTESSGSARFRGYCPACMGWLTYEMGIGWDGVEQAKAAWLEMQMAHQEKCHKAAALGRAFYGLGRALGYIG